MDRFSKLSISLRYYLQGKGYYNALKAWNFAEDFHCGYRKDGVSPELIHQIEIGHYLRTMPILPDEELCLAVGFLHDTAEDKNVAFVEISNLFGSDVARHVQTLSKTFRGVSMKTEAYYYQGIALHPVTALVKGADRINNVGSMVGVFTPEKQKAYCVETREFVIPMLKQARRSFPEYEPSFENMKHNLNQQLILIEKMSP
jgi:(p)ppGpp synthase/HD superfamily hydrolase